MFHEYKFVPTTQKLKNLKKTLVTMFEKKSFTFIFSL